MRKKIYLYLCIGIFTSLLATVFFVTLAADSESSAGKYKLIFSSTRNELTDIYTIFNDGSELTQLTNTDDSKNAYVVPRWSPDGSRILFLKRITKSIFNIVYELWLMNADGTEPQQLSGSLERIVMPSWSPDGQKILFVAKNDKYKAIMLYDIAKNEIQNLVDSDIQDIENRFISWTRDGNSVVAALKIDGKTDIYYLDVNSKNLRKITEKSANYYEPTLSPDETLIAFGYRKSFFDLFGKGSGLYMMDATGSAPKLVLKFDLIKHIAWSPDSATIAFVPYKSEAYKDGQGNVKSNTYNYLYVYNPGEKKPKRLLSMGNWESMPFWSPDGKNLAITITGTLQVFQSGVKKPLKLKVPYATGDPSWSPDSRLIACVGYTGGLLSKKANIYLASLEDTTIIKLTEDSDYGLPSWNPHPASN